MQLFIFTPHNSKGMNSFSRINNITGWLVFAVALIVYTMTMEATASFWDCGEFIAATYKLQVVHPPGAPIFLMVGRIFTLFASGPEQVPLMTNFFSALSTAFGALFVFWIITRMMRKSLAGTNEPSGSQLATIMFGGIIGATCFLFMDSIWFSAVESEVYALATFFFILIFWSIVKWEAHADDPNSDRWILFMALMMGLSIGVHLLALLVIPAIALIYYFRNYTYSRKGLIYTLLIGTALVAFVLYGLLDKFIAIAAAFDRTFVNDIGLPIGSGIIVFSLIVVGGIVYGIRHAIQRNKRILYITMMSFTMLIIGLTSYAMVLIRAKAEPVINMNGINDVHSFLSYLKREQYGSRALFYGPYWTAQPIQYEKGKAKFGVVPGKDGYQVISHEFEPVYDIPAEYLNSPNVSENARLIQERNKQVLFPRMGSLEDRHAGLYYDFANVDPAAEQTYVPTYGENLKFLFNYQLGHMFWRYFMWNFSGRQNDTQGNFYDGYKDGNWVTGIEAIDKTKNEQLEEVPPSLKNVLTHNNYYMLPFILGIMGMVYQLRKDKRGFAVVLTLFLFMGIMNIINMNQPPTEPRERDYAQVGAFFAFAIWIGFGIGAIIDLAKNFKSKTIQEYVLYSALILLSMFFLGLTMYSFTNFLMISAYLIIVMLLMGGIAYVINNAMKKEMALAVVAFLLCIPAPFLMASQGWDDHNRSDRTFARDIARNYLESCPPNAILFTQGDNDTYPLWYAQEVENIRPDVKIINLSLLGVDWYINQLRHATNESAPIALTLSADKILGDKRNQVVDNDKSKFKNQTMELKDVLEFIGQDDPKFQVYSEGLEDYFSYVPTKKFKLTIDAEKMKANNIVPEALVENMKKELNFELKRGTLLKNDLMTLDIVANNINNRPICFAISVTADSHLGMEKYLMQRNMVYQLMPVEMENNKSQMDGYRKQMNTDIQYDLLVNQKDKFTYGGVERGGEMYIDPSGMGSVLTTKYLNYFELAKNLDQERQYLEAQARQMMTDTVNKEYNEVGQQLMQESADKKKKTIEVLDLMQTLFPDSSVPYDFNMVNVAQVYQRLGENEKAMAIVTTMKERVMQELEYYYKMTLKSSLTASMFEDDKLRSETWVYYTVNMARSAGDKDFAEALDKEWETLRMKYGILAPNERGRK
ncbi:MAG TPA: DUF2723 domain-containing protein [Chitinophagales bacterium]|nr:DUF2723 domain-containing protein [Chitinophagales bacterium]HRH52560.1 DUF2723 domain-containing protein [Chitinophagales bacterium]